MSYYNFRTLIRDALVDNAGIKSVFAAGATGSCRVNMDFLIVSAVYPQVIIGYSAGQTTPGMGGSESQIFLTTECKGSGALHAHKELGNFRRNILNVLDDTNLSATSTCYKIRKFTEITGFDEQKKVHWLQLGFNAQFLENNSLP